MFASNQLYVEPRIYHHRHWERVGGISPSPPLIPCPPEVTGAVSLGPRYRGKKKAVERFDSAKSILNEYLKSVNMSATHK